MTIEMFAAVLALALTLAIMGVLLAFAYQAITEADDDARNVDDDDEPPPAPAGEGGIGDARLAEVASLEALLRLPDAQPGNDDQRRM